MKTRQFTVAGLALAMFWLGTAVGLSQETQPDAAEKSGPAEMVIYAAPTKDDVQSDVLQWVAARGTADEAVLKQIGTLWAEVPAEADARTLLDRSVETFALADPAVRAFVEACRLNDPALVPPEATVLAEAEPSSFFAANLRLFYARYLAQRQMYDEGLAQFSQLDPQHVVDPAGCLFYRAVCEHALLQKETGLKTIDSLLKNTENVPVAYSSVATLMRYDLEALEDKSLDSISRKMRDSERRLDLARGGPKVQKVQSEIIAELDEIIEKLEQQAGGGGGGGAGGNSNQSNGPANDSIVKGSTAPGEVDRKSYKNEGGWGNLPEKEQAKAKNLIGREFPAHYRQAVEEYFKKLAARRGDR